MNPMLLRLLLAMASAVMVVLSDNQMDFNSIMLYLGGYSAAWGLQRRPGDTPPPKGPGTYTGLGIFLLLVVMLPFGPALQGCKNAMVDWPKLIQCGSDVSNDAIGKVAEILLSDGGSSDTSISIRGKNALADLALAHGADVIGCLVDRLVRDWTAPGASQHPERVAAAARGRDFLCDTGARKC